MFRVGQGLNAIRHSRRGAIALACVLATTALSGCWWDDTQPVVARDPTDCPTAPSVVASSISSLRSAGFAGDVPAQFALAQAYDGGQGLGRPDPIEAAVWYTLALANPASYSAGFQEDAQSRPDCNGVRRKLAGQALWRLVRPLSSTETADIRDRAEYILAASGAGGYRTLSRLYSRRFGAFGEPLPAENMAGGAVPVAAIGPDLFPDNDIDSQVFVWLSQHGDGASAQATDPVGQRAVQWRPAYEFYPPSSPAGPLSDESAYINRGDAAAIARIEQQPFAIVGAALQSVGVTSDLVRLEAKLPPSAAARFQAMIGDEPTGKLSALDKVRTIQYAAAIKGNANAQAVLGAMYVQGIGVRPNIAKARMWLDAAARQKHAKARLALNRLNSQGR